MSEKKKNLETVHCNNNCCWISFKINMNEWTKFTSSFWVFSKMKLFIIKFKMLIGMSLKIQQRLEIFENLVGKEVLKWINDLDYVGDCWIFWWLWINFMRKCSKKLGYSDSLRWFLDVWRKMKMILPREKLKKIKLEKSNNF